MDTKDIRCFQRVYEEASINKAAKQLFITPQGLSKIIHNMEEEFHTRLFERSSKGMVPTESGVYLYENCKELLYKMEEIGVGIRRIQERSNKMRIGFSCGVLNVFPFSRLEQYKEMCPEIQTECEEAGNDEIKNMILLGELDVAFVIGPVVGEELFVKELYRKNPDVIVYEGHPFYEKERLSVEDLKNEKLVTLNEKYYSYHSLVQRCHDFDFIPLIAVKTMESQLIYRFCKEGVGLGIDVNIHKDEVSDEGLHRVELYDALPWKISIICRKNRTEERPIQKMLKFF